MEKKISIAIAEDHDMVRQGMVSLFAEEEAIEVMFDVANGADLLEEIKTKKPDIVLLDLEMPIIDGHQALKVLRERYPNVKVLIVSMHTDRDFIMESISNGACGFLPKNSDFDKVVDAIFSVHEKGFFFDDLVSQSLVMEVRNGNGANSGNHPSPLSAREINIIELICKGMKNREIADLLYLSVRTVEGHRQRISEKTETDNLAALVIYAIKNGIYKIH